MRMQQTCPEQYNVRALREHYQIGTEHYLRWLAEFDLLSDPYPARAELATSTPERHPPARAERTLL